MQGVAHLLFGLGFEFFEPRVAAHAPHLRVHTSILTNARAGLSELESNIELSQLCRILISRITNWQNQITNYSSSQLPKQSSELRHAATERKQEGVKHQTRAVLSCTSYDAGYLLLGRGVIPGTFREA